MTKVPSYEPSALFGGPPGAGTNLLFGLARRRRPLPARPKFLGAGTRSDPGCSLKGTVSGCCRIAPRPGCCGIAPPLCCTSDTYWLELV